MKKKINIVKSRFFRERTSQATLVHKGVYRELSTPLISLMPPHSQIVAMVNVRNGDTWSVDCCEASRRVLDGKRCRDIKGLLQLFHGMMATSAHTARHTAPVDGPKRWIKPQARNNHGQQSQSEPSTTAAFLRTATVNEILIKNALVDYRCSLGSLPAWILVEISLRVAHAVI